jgi:hypothetical protein
MATEGGKGLPPCQTNRLQRAGYWIMKMGIKRNLIQICLLGALLLLALPVVVQAQFQTITNNGAITIVKYTGSSGAVIIPDTINGYPVTSIGTNAFFGSFNTFSSSVTMGSNVTSIGSQAFANSVALKNVIIGNNVTNIGDATFSQCTFLTNIVFGTNIANIGTNVCYQCSYLSSATIPNSVTSIGSQAFANCGNMISVTIPNGVTSIGDSAFYGCWLTNVTIPNSVTNLGAAAFYGCGNLTNVAIGTNITTIKTNAFYQCTKLVSVTILDSVTSIGGTAFYQCTSLNNVTVGNGVTNIEYEAFANCGSSLRALYFQGNAPTVGSNLFTGDYSVTLGNAVVYYLPGTTGWGPTFGTGSGPTLGGLRAFLPFPPYNCTTDNGTIAVNQYTGSGGAVIIPSTVNGLPVTRIGDYTFYQCTSLTSVTIPDSVTSIGTNAFYNCTGLTNVIIPNSVINIANNAFVHCSSLTSVTIPNNVASIGNFAFNNCTSLTGVYFTGNAPSLGSSVFTGDTSAIVYYLPGTTGWGATFGGLRTWNPQAQNDASFGVQTNQFGFNIAGNTNLIVVVEACTDLANSTWSPVATNTLTGGSSYFSDPQWTNYPGRFYRFRSP